MVFFCQVRHFLFTFFVSKCFFFCQVSFLLGYIKEQKYRREWELNPRHMDYDSIVLTTELFRQKKNILYIVFYKKKQ